MSGERHVVRYPPNTARWYLVNICIYLLVLALVWGVAFTSDAAVSSTSLGRELTTLTAAFPFLVIVFGIPSVGLLVLVRVLSRRFRSARFRLLAILIVLPGGVLAALTPWPQIAITQLVVQILFGLLLRPLPLGERSLEGCEPVSTPSD